MLKRCHADVDL